MFRFEVFEISLQGSRSDLLALHKAFLKLLKWHDETEYGCNTEAEIGECTQMSVRLRNIEEFEFLINRTCSSTL
jgi:hypothetical protein